MLNIYEQVDSNKRKSTFIIVGFVVFIALAVYLLSQAFGYDNSLTVVAILVAMATSLGSYYYSDQIILALSQAHPATKEKDFNFYTVTANLSLGSQLPMPKLYVIDDSAMNAFATGRDPNHAVVVATRGLLERLDRTELEGVIAHELSHVKNYD